VGFNNIVALLLFLFIYFLSFVLYFFIILYTLLSPRFSYLETPGETPPRRLFFIRLPPPIPRYYILNMLYSAEQRVERFVYGDPDRSRPAVVPGTLARRPLIRSARAGQLSFARRRGLFSFF